jgi:hypothetical protein
MSGHQPIHLSSSIAWQRYAHHSQATKKASYTPRAESRAAVRPASQQQRGHSSSRALPVKQHLITRPLSSQTQHMPLGVPLFLFAQRTLWPETINSPAVLHRELPQEWTCIRRVMPTSIIVQLNT